MNIDLKSKCSSIFMTPDFLYTAVSTSILGLIAHGYIMVNKIAIHDEADQLYGQTLNTISQGRWMQELIRRIEIFLFSYNRLSTTYLYGIYAILAAVFLAYFIVRTYCISGKVNIFILSGFIVSCPTFLMMLGYSYFLPYYITGIFIAVFGVGLLLNLPKGLFSVIVSAIFICCATGIYQSYFTFALSLVYLKYLNIVEDEQFSFKSFVLNGLYYASSFMAGIILYLIINKITLAITHMNMMSYADLDTMGMTTIKGYIERIKVAYCWFWAPPPYEMNTFFPLGSNFLYKILVFICSIVVFIELYEGIKQRKKNVIQVSMLIGLLPTIVFLILILAGTSSLSPLNLPTYITLIVFFLQRTQYIKNRMVHRYAHLSIGGILLLINIFFIRYDNACYLKAEMVQSEMKEYFSVLVMRIKSAEGYDDEIPVMYINEWGKSDMTLTQNQAYILTPTWPYKLNESDMLNDFAWRSFMRNWCGFNPFTIEYSSVEDEEIRREIEEMPSYPDDGSIKRFDGFVAVKF